jgi:predicted Zn-dependent protease
MNPYRRFNILLALICSLPLNLVAQTEDDYAEAGQKALAAGQYAVARTNFEKLARLHPEVAEVHANLAIIDFKLRDYEHAVEEIRTAKKLKTGLANLDSLLGMSLAELGQYNDAVAGLEEGFTKAPNPSTQRMCGLQLLRAYTGLHRDADAVSVALDLNRIFPNDPEVLYNTSRIYGNHAFLTMHKLEEVAPTSVWRHQAAAEAWESQGSADSAISEYRKVLNLEPARPGIHYRIGRTLLARFQHDHAPEDQVEAAKEFELELQQNPADADALYELAELRRQQNDLGKAQQLFEAALKHYPDFQEAQVGLATVLMANQKPDLALPHLERAVALNANDEVAWYRLSQADRALGKAEEQKKALAEFQRLHAQIAIEKGTNVPADVTKQALQSGEVQ